MPTVRAIEVADRQGWEALYRGYQAFYGFHDRPADFYDSAFGRLVSGDAHDFRGLVAEAGGALVGLAHHVFHPNLWRPEGVCYLQDLFTAPEARGQGIGRALISAVYAAADAGGTPAVYWLTAADNPARALYDRVATRTPFVRYVRPL